MTHKKGHDQKPRSQGQQGIGKTQRIGHGIKPKSRTPKPTKISTKL